MATLTGTVIKAQSGFFWIRTDDGVLRCTLRGRLKKSRVPTDIATLGDEVIITPTVNGEGVVEDVLPRRSKLARRAAGSKGAWKEDVIVANLDQVLAVFAVARPDPHLRMLDRYLITAELSGVDAVIVANKCDLRPRAEIDALFAPYTGIGYPVLFTSAAQNIGIDALREQVKDKISAFSGPSGVGKSSLMNRLQPGLGLRTSEVSDFVNKGRHTTVVAELHPLDFGGFVADTPGIREMGLWQAPPEELDWCFRELRPYIGECYFRPCSHVHEPDCAIREAVTRGDIAAVRYDSYTRLYDEVSAAVTY